jgi:hypothetical protein
MSKSMLGEGMTVASAFENVMEVCRCQGDRRKRVRMLGDGKDISHLVPRPQGWHCPEGNAVRMEERTEKYISSVPEWEGSNGVLHTHGGVVSRQSAVGI